MPIVNTFLPSAKQAYAAGDMAAAERFCRSAIAVSPATADPWVVLGYVEMQRGRVDEALTIAAKAVALEPRNPFVHLFKCHALMAAGRLGEALATAQQATGALKCPAAALDGFGAAFIHIGKYEAALKAYRKALAAEPANPRFLYNVAFAERACGALAESERHFDQAIARNPRYGLAYFMRANLRRQTPERNHVAEMESAAAAGTGDPEGDIALRFALAKECEDIGQHARGMRHLLAGAARQRAGLRYRVADDVTAMDRIVASQSREALDRLATLLDSGSVSDEAPIFILGLPRSGTTLVERIVGGHDAVYAAGELGTLPFVLDRAAAAAGLSQPDGWIDGLERIDLAALGRDYVRSARDNGIPSGQRFTDKNPPNFRFCGAISLALPNARIVAMRRNPMDGCFAAFKILFNGANHPYSYDLIELAEYYAAFHRLMAHWRETLPPDRYIEVAYEDVVADLEGQSRRLLAFLGLPWTDEVLRFHESTAPAPTASAVQVRQPIYATSVGNWRNYAEQLEPLRARLAALLPDEDLGGI
jgi:tetratricopeptide (TPR) repeat protein